MGQQSLNLKNLIESEYDKEISDEELFDYKNKITKLIEIFIEIDKRSKN